MNTWLTFITYPIAKCPSEQSSVSLQSPNMPPLSTVIIEMPETKDKLIAVRFFFRKDKR